MRLRSIGSGHTHLKLLVSEQSSTRQRYKDLLGGQISSSQRLDRWSQAEENPALQDVLHQVHDLNLMWVEAEREYVGKCVFLKHVHQSCVRWWVRLLDAVALKDYKKVFENILAVEKKLDIAKKHLVSVVRAKKVRQ